MLKRSADMEAMIPYWDLSDAVIGGIQKLREGKTTYLPKFYKESNEEYNSRLELTKYTNIYHDIIKGLSDKPFQEEVALIQDTNKPAPSTLVNFMEDVDGAGRNITMFSNDIFYHGINSALDWIFVDYPSVDTNVKRTKEDAQKIGTRPYWSRILARNVLDARVVILEGEECLSYIKIFEPSDGENRVRVIELNDVRVATWKLYVEVKKANAIEEYELEKSGTYEGIDCIPIVPFITGRRKGRTFYVDPAMRDAVDLSVELYQEESGLKFAKKLTAYPMLSGNGVKPPTKTGSKEPEPLRVGPGRVLYAPPSADGSSGGNWQYLEPDANSLTFLTEEIRETKKDLRELGRQPLTAQSGNLTVITTQVAAGKSKSAVKAWALILKNTLEKLMILTAKWYDIDDYEPQINVFMDFDNFIDGKDYDTLVKLRQDRDLSYETYCAELKRRGLLSPEFNTEEEIAKILADPFIETEDNDDENQ